MKWVSLYPWIWWAWVGIFVIGEAIPLAFGKPQYTLSEYLWRDESLGSPWTALRYFIAVTSLWLFFHLTFGWFR